MSTNPGPIATPVKLQGGRAQSWDSSSRQPPGPPHRPHLDLLVLRGAVFPRTHGGDGHEAGQLPAVRQEEGQGEAAAHGRADEDRPPQAQPLHDVPQEGRPTPLRGHRPRGGRIPIAWGGGGREDAGLRCSGRAPRALWGGRVPAWRCGTAPALSLLPGRSMATARCPSAASSASVPRACHVPELKAWPCSSSTSGLRGIGGGRVRTRGLGTARGRRPPAEGRPRPGGTRGAAGRPTCWPRGTAARRPPCRRRRGRPAPLPPAPWRWPGVGPGRGGGRRAAAAAGRRPAERPAPAAPRGRGAWLSAGVGPPPRGAPALNPGRDPVRPRSARRGSGTLG